MTSKISHTQKKVSLIKLNHLNVWLITSFIKLPLE